jgi:peroxiredoxin
VSPRSRHAAALALLGLLSALALHAPASAQAGAEERIELSDLDGSRVSLAPNEARPAVVLHFWATWCSSCGDELPALARAWRACTARSDRLPFALYLVNVDEERDEIERYAKAHGLEGLPQLRDPNGRVWRALSGAGLPVNVRWTREERRVELGPRSEEQWREVLAGLGCGTHPAANGSPAATVR